jgi:hypothetical protein
MTVFSSLLNTDKKPVGFLRALQQKVTDSAWKGYRWANSVLSARSDLGGGSYSWATCQDIAKHRNHSGSDLRAIARTALKQSHRKFCQWMTQSSIFGPNRCSVSGELCTPSKLTENNWNIWPDMHSNNRIVNFVFLHQEIRWKNFSVDLPWTREIWRFSPHSDIGFRYLECEWKRTSFFCESVVQCSVSIALHIFIHVSNLGPSTKSHAFHSIGNGPNLIIRWAIARPWKNRKLIISSLLLYLWWKWYLTFMMIDGYLTCLSRAWSFTQFWLTLQVSMSRLFERFERNVSAFSPAENGLGNSKMQRCWKHACVPPEFGRIEDLDVQIVFSLIYGRSIGIEIGLSS